MLKWVKDRAENEGLEIPFGGSLIKLNPAVFCENQRNFFMCLHRNIFRQVTNEKIPICKNKSGFNFGRRMRDSNPRYLAVQQFSRLPQSTTLPILRDKSSAIFLFDKC